MNNLRRVLFVLAFICYTNSIYADEVYGTWQIHPQLEVNFEFPNFRKGMIQFVREALVVGIDVFYSIFNLPEGVERPNADTLLPFETEL